MEVVSLNEVKYSLVDGDSHEKLFVASSNILPGEVLFEEQPLLFISEIPSDKQEYYTMLQQFSPIPGMIWYVYDEFQELSEEKKNSFMNLFGPTDCEKAINIREILTQLIQLLEHSIPQLDLIDTELFVKIAMIYESNVIVGDEENNRELFIFNNISRVAHSCQPNCHLIFGQSDVGVVRSILPIQKGEKLTISHPGVDVTNPTYIRQDFLRKKGFTCECARCTALGDDTRQFNCFDKNCVGGRHYACQKSSTDVPYLLACVVCGQTPPDFYAQQMFLQEEKLPIVAKQLAFLQNGAISQLMTNGRYDLPEYDTLMNTVKYPKYHYLCTDIHFAYIHYSKAKAMKSGESVSVEETIELVKQYVQPLEHMPLLSPSDRKNQIYFLAASILLKCNTVEADTIAVKYVQLARRHHQLLHGRDNCDVNLDNMTIDVLARSFLRNNINANIATATTTNSNNATTTVQCFVCGESDMTAAIKLRKCGRCRKVLYCGVGCQNVHWKVHRKECKKAETNI